MSFSHAMVVGNSDYHKHSAIGSTTLKNYLINPVTAYKKYTGEIEQKTTDAMIFGSLVHTLTLEPHTFCDEFVVIPDHLFTKSGALSTAKAAKEEMEALRAESNGKTLVTPKQVEEAQQIADKALSYEFQITTGDQQLFFTTRQLIAYEQTRCEMAFHATIDGLDMKTKPDILVEVGENTVIAIDLKTCKEPTPETFTKQGGNLYYPVQEAHYTKVLEANGLTVAKFIFLFVGKDAGTGAQQYEYGDISKVWGIEMWKKAIELHKKAMAGEVRETVYIDGHYDREPILEIPNYMFYKQ